MIKRNCLIILLPLVLMIFTIFVIPQVVFAQTNPVWGSAVRFENTLTYSGGSISAIVDTSDYYSITVTSVTLTLTKPDGTTVSNSASNVANAFHFEATPAYTSRAWKFYFIIQPNTSISSQTYYVTASSPAISGTTTSSFTIPPPPTYTINRLMQEIMAR